MLYRHSPPALVVLALLACNGSPSSSDDDSTLAPDDDSTPGTDDDSTPVLPPAWDPGLPPSTEVASSRRGWQELRGIIHLHSPYSHDACDGEPMPGGVPDEKCLAHLREALCLTHQDFAFLTNHPDSASEQPYHDLLELREGDEEVMNAQGDPIANRMGCPDGTSVLWMPGIESGEMMPVGLERQAGAEGDAEANDAVYNDDSPEAVEAVRQAGALAFIAHTESKDIEILRSLADLTGFEGYNLHANVDPDIREEWLGLDGWGWLEGAAPFLSAEPESPEPDLLILGFWAPNTPALSKFDTLLAEGRRITLTGGTDAHENTLPGLLRDGERGDSYRRMIRWFSNHLLASENSPEALKEALEEGRSFISFDGYGIPEGFDFTAETKGGVVAEMGETSVAAEATLKVSIPHLLGGNPSWAEPPDIYARLIRAQAPEGVVVAEGGEDLTLADPKPGAYRVEITLVPHHLAPYLGADPAMYMNEVIWIYSGAIHLE